MPLRHGPQPDLFTTDEGGASFCNGYENFPTVRYGDAARIYGFLLISPHACRMPPGTRRIDMPHELNSILKWLKRTLRASKSTGRSRCYEEALRRKPDFWPALHKLGLALRLPRLLHVLSPARAAVCFPEGGARPNAARGNGPEKKSLQPFPTTPD